MGLKLFGSALLVVAFILVASSTKLCKICTCDGSIYPTSAQCYNTSLEDPSIALGSTVSYLYINKSTVGPLFLRDLNEDLKHFFIVNSNVSGVDKLTFKKLFEVTLIGIVGSQLEDLEPTTFHSNTKLRHVDLSGNKIGDASSSLFAQQPDLEMVNLSNNTLKCIRKSTFAINRKIRFLDLSSNQIQSVEPEAFNVSLVSNLSSPDSNIFINISVNALTEILNNTFSLCSNVTELKLSNNNITHLRPKAFAGLESLRDLLLANNSLGDLTPGVFHPLKSLQFLDLRYNRLQKIQADAFNASPVFQLRLTGNKIVELDAQAFRGLTWLSHLYLDDNILETVGDAFKTLLPGLIYLDGSRNRISDIQREAFSGCSSLQKLELKGNIIKTVDNKAFTSNYNLKELHLQHNRIAHLFDPLFFNIPPLETLGLDEYMLTRYPLSYFLSLKSLRALTLRHNNSIECKVSWFLEQKKLVFEFDLEDSVLQSACFQLLYKDTLYNEPGYNKQRDFIGVYSEGINGTADYYRKHEIESTTAIDSTLASPGTEGSTPSFQISTTTRDPVQDIEHVETANMFPSVEVGVLFGVLIVIILLLICVIICQNRKIHQLSSLSEPTNATTVTQQHNR